MTDVRDALRRGRRAVRGLRGRLASRAPGALERHRDSWRSGDVARQMEALAERELTAPESSPPFRAFLRLVPLLAADPLLPDPARFLDIACGVGAYADLLDRYAPGRFTYVGADYSEETLAVARRRSPARTFERRDLFDADALRGHDVVFASALLDVLPEPGRALATLLGADAPVVVLHRQRMGARRGSIGIVSGYRGQTTYSTTITRLELGAAAATAGRELSASIEVDGDVWSFVLRRS